MLIVNDRSELGDKRLSPEEGLAQLKERNQVLIDQRKMPGQRELENSDRSAGPCMAWQDLILKIQACNFTIQARDGSPGNIALYALKRSDELRADAWDHSKTDFFNDHKYVGGFPKEPMPEYAHVILDEKGLVKREYRGWRSVLLALISAHAITLEAADKHFGKPTGERSWRWYQQTYELHQ